jgi:3-oxoacyl-[acyl-carrier protein] reductase
LMRDSRRQQLPSAWRRCGTPVRLARIGDLRGCLSPILFLASDAMSGYVTGQILPVNGGQDLAVIQQSESRPSDGQ